MTKHDLACAVFDIAVFGLIVALVLSQLRVVPTEFRFAWAIAECALAAVAATAAWVKRDLANILAVEDADRLVERDIDHARGHDHDYDHAD